VVDGHELSPLTAPDAGKVDTFTPASPKAAPKPDADIDELTEKIEAVAAALPMLRKTIPRIPLGRAVAIVDPILERLRAFPNVAALLAAPILYWLVGTHKGPASSAARSGPASLASPLAGGCCVGVLTPSPSHLY
jgi:hypothetical protein